jgi:hypothetical protein
MMFWWYQPFMEHLRRFGDYNTIQMTMGIVEVLFLATSIAVLDRFTRMRQWISGPKLVLAIWLVELLIICGFAITSEARGGLEAALIVPVIMIIILPAYILPFYLLRALLGWAVPRSVQ